MAWFSGRVSLGNLDLVGAVNKLQESVKNIEKNFDSALGLEETPDSNGEASGLWPSATDRKTLFDPVMALMGHKKEENISEDDISESSQYPIGAEDLVGNMESSQNLNVKKDNIDLQNEKLIHSVSKETVVEDAEQFVADGDNVFLERKEEISTEDATLNLEDDSELPHLPIETLQPITQNEEELDSGNFPEKNISEIPTIQNTEVILDQTRPIEVHPLEVSTIFSDKCHDVVDVNVIKDEQENDVVDMSEQKIHVDGLGKHKTGGEEGLQNVSIVQSEVTQECQDEHGIEIDSPNIKENESNHLYAISHAAGVTLEKTSDPASRLDSNEDEAPTKLVKLDQQINDGEMGVTKQSLSSEANLSDSSESVVALEKLKMEMKMMETALQGAARQAQAKADEIAKLMNENENLKSMIEDLKRKSNDAEIESLREEYHQRLATVERKAYALAKERDALKREQNKKSDSAALLKEKDEIINQVMAEGEELSKKQAAQEYQIRKLRAQIRELEEEKKTFITKLQVEESKVESIKRDKTATEKLLQETIENHQNELASQKEYHTNALSAAKEAEALAEARANNEARTELERCLREAEEREALLVQTLEELRQTLSRKEQQVVFREDMLRRDIEDLQKRYQASERRCEELITQVPESTRPLIRQIEAMQETTARRAEAWAAVERSLNSRLQEAEAKTAAAEERERSVNDRLSQTLSRINVLEAQMSCLRAEQAQLSKSLEKERQLAAEIRKELFATKEESDTHEGRANQLEEEIRELRQQHKRELQEALMHRELLQQEVHREKSARLDLEKTARLNSTSVSDQTSLQRRSSTFENANLTRKLSSASSLGSMEESHFLQASLDSSDSLFDKRNVGEATLGPYHVKSMTPSAFEAALRQKDGELSSYMSRLQSLESIRDSLAEELVKMTAQNEKFRAEATILPGIRAELDALRRRHSAALELMGERDEELEELRADIVDLKEMYREQVNLLVNKISSIDTSK